MAAATYYVTPAGAGAKDGAAWASAMGEAEFEADLEANAEPGDIYYFLEGTYTLDSAYDSLLRDGTIVAPICLIGVKSGTTNEPPVLADWSDANLSGGADDRPLFACGANQWVVGDYHKIFNFRFTTTYVNGVGGSVANTVFYNCKVTQSGASANRRGFNVGGDAISILCEATGLVGTGVVARLFYCGTGTVIFSWGHDGNEGFYLSAVRGTVLFSGAEDCSVAGLNLYSHCPLALGNTINDCATGITNVASDWMTVVNNLLEGCTTDGIKATTQQDGAFYWKNHGDDARNLDMWDGVATSGPHADLTVSSGDPLLDGDGNVSLQVGSPCRNNALQSVLGT